MTKDRDQHSDQKFKKQLSGNQLGKRLNQKSPNTKHSDSKNSDSKKFAFEEDTRARQTSPQKNKLVQPLNDMRMGELHIERLGHDGRGIAYWEQNFSQEPTSIEKQAHHGKIVFIAQALPGEKITARLSKEHSRYIEARVEQVVTASEDRIQPACQYFAQCGGCQLQHITNAFQLKFKQTSLLEQLGDSLKPKKLLAPIESPSFGYRRAARLAVSYLNGLALGFREENSHNIVSINSCTVLTPSLNQLIQPLHVLLETFRQSESITHIELIDALPSPGLIFRSIKKLTPIEIGALAEFEENNSVKVFLQTREGLDLLTLAGDFVDPRFNFSLTDFSLQLQFHPRDFIQVNESVNQRMVSQAIQLLQLQPTDRVLDLFCGIGNFTLALASVCKEVIGIEAVDAMVQRARENATLNRIHNAQFIASDLTKLTENRLKQVCGKIDAVLLDPPREGAKEIVEKLKQLLPSRIVYVSCNPSTLARDAKVLSASGYQLDSLGVMDMFPQTAHLESMALFVRKK